MSNEICCQYSQTRFIFPFFSGLNKTENSKFVIQVVSLFFEIAFSWGFLDFSGKENFSDKAVVDYLKLVFSKCEASQLKLERLLIDARACRSSITKAILRPLKARKRVSKSLPEYYRRPILTVKGIFSITTLHL